LLCIYISIRDFYHSHTHHTKHDDILLKPIRADSKRKAVEKILIQYEEKIIYYHKIIKEDLGQDSEFEQARDLITKAEGEMTYASAFTRLLKDCIEDSEKPTKIPENTFEVHKETADNTSKSKPSIDNFELYLSVFSNAIKSIRILAEDLESKYLSKLTQDTKLESESINRLTQALTVLTLVILILTVPIATDATYEIAKSILEHFGLALCLLQKFSIAGVYVVISIVAIIKVLNTRRKERGD